MQTIAKSLSDPISLYRKMVKITISHLSAQRLDVAPHAKSLLQYFIQLPTLRTWVQLPQHFVLRDEFRNAVPALTSLSETIFGCVHERHVLSEWISTVVMFPRLIALAFGFGDVHFVIDHCELADIDVVPAPPFDGRVETVALFEYFKLMLSYDSYILSCLDEDRFVDCLESLTSEGVNLRDGTELVSVVDIDKGHADRYLFSLKVEGELSGIRLKITDCGGCLGFLYLWDGIVIHADRLHNEEKRDSRSRTAKELRLSLLAKIRELSGLVLFKVDQNTGLLEPINKRIKNFAIVGTGAEIDRE
jgi:hypothetical protein